MDRTVVYAINHKGFTTRPGYVLDPGQPGQKVRAKVYWTWPDQDQDYLNPDPPLYDERAKCDIKQVETNEVLCRWSVYCANVKRDRQEAIAKREAEAAEELTAKQVRLDRLAAVAPLINGFGGYCDLQDLRYLLQADRTHDSRYSALHVVQLLEYVQHMVNQNMVGPVHREVSQ